MIRDKQLRVVYSLLKPAMRMAARFNIPVRSLSELVRLAYYEVLAHEGHSQTEIAQRFGQSARHVRSLARRYSSDFFLAEKEVGLVREMEDFVATHAPTRASLEEQFSGFGPDEIGDALQSLLREGRVTEEQGRLRVGTPYVVLSSESFHHRIDALNHHLEALSRAVLQRLIFNRQGTAMIKTISFSASPEELEAYLSRLEGDLRRDLAELEEHAAFEGRSRARFALGMTVSMEPPEE